MLRSSLISATALMLCATASAQQQIQARKVPTAVRDAGIYHMSTGTWTRNAGSQANLGPDVIYKNDAQSGYFGVGWSGQAGIDEGVLPGTGNPAGGPQDAYLINGMTFAYCDFGIGTSWACSILGSYLPCDLPFTAPAGCFDVTTPKTPILGLPAAGCWIVTIDLAGGGEFCVEADGGSCAPGYDADLNLDSFGIQCTFTSTTISTGPILTGDPNWSPEGEGTCYNPAITCGGSATGLGTQDFFAIDKPGALGPGCYWFGGYVNNNGCGFASNNPFASGWSVAYTDCTVTCSGGSVTTFCTSTVHPTAVMSIDTTSATAAAINVGASGLPASQFGYLLQGTGSGTITNPSGATGTLCLGGAPIGRYNKDVASTGAGGTLNTNLQASLTAGSVNPTPPGGDIDAGETWRFQYWFRRPMTTAGFSEGIEVLFN